MSETIEQMMLQVLDAPDSVRIVIMTSVPALVDGEDDLESLRCEEMLECLYYMIDRKEDKWFVTTSCGGAIDIPSHNLLLLLVTQILAGSPTADIYVDSL